MCVRIYHNPRCSKSRKALQLLEQQGEKLEIIDYLKDPPDAAQLAALLDLLGLQPRELIRRTEPEYTTSGAKDPNLSAAQLIDLMIRHPKLIERPIVVKGAKAAVGRPPELVLDIL